MAEEPDSIVLRYLREIPERLDVMEAKIDDMSARTDGHTALLIGLGKYIRDIDERVEHLEAAIGAMQ